MEAPPESQDLSLGAGRSGAPAILHYTGRTVDSTSETPHVFGGEQPKSVAKFRFAWRSGLRGSHWSAWGLGLLAMPSGL